MNFRREDKTDKGIGQGDEMCIRCNKKIGEFGQRHKWAPHIGKALRAEEILDRVYRGTDGVEP